MFRSVASSSVRTTHPARFLVTFGLAWLALDRLVSSPLTTGSAVLALTVAGSVLAVDQIVVGHRSGRDAIVRLGLGRPDGRALLAAIAVGAAFAVVAFGTAGLLGIAPPLRSNWPDVLVGVVLFHGIAEELVWRGFALGHLRRTRSFWRAVLASTPLIGATHVPILLHADLGVAILAVLSAIVTCLPFAYLWERGQRTIWAPAILHAVIGTWQLFERRPDPTFSMLVVTASILVPLSAFAFGDRYFGRALEPGGSPPPISGSPATTATAPGGTTPSTPKGDN